MSVQASMTIAIDAQQTYAAPATSGDIGYSTAVTEHWSAGQASGEVDRPFRKVGSLAASASDTLNFLAAGALEDALGNTVDLDEIKGFVIKCTSGSIAVTGLVAGLACFTGTDEGIKLTSGQSFGINFGAGGLSTAGAGSIKITETSTTLTAGYELTAVGAE